MALNLTTATLIIKPGWIAPHQPAIHLDETVDPHGRPYADFGHLGILIINNMPKRFVIDTAFNLEMMREQFKRKARKYKELLRINAQTISATCLCDIPKEKILSGIQNKFKADVQYICVASEIDNNFQQSRLNVQIISKETVNRFEAFLDSYTSTQWKYQITEPKDDRHWNEYIKKGCRLPAKRPASK